MTNKDFQEELNSLGFPLFTSQEAVNAGLVLEQMVQSRDLRLWEGFPVVLANSLERNQLDYTKSLDALKDKKTKDNFRLLSLMALTLYRFLGLKFNWALGVKALLKGNKEFDLFLQGVPIFEDFDSVIDKIKLTKYVNKFQTRSGIKLSRHRVVLVVQKLLS